MKRKSDLIRRVGARLLLRDSTKKVLTKMFGDSWRIRFLRFSGFGPIVGAHKNETVVLGGCYRFETIRDYYEVVGAEGRIIAIEANKENAEELRNAIAKDPELTTATNITLIAKGIW